MSVTTTRLAVNPLRKKIFLAMFVRQGIPCEKQGFSRALESTRIRDRAINGGNPVQNLSVGQDLVPGKHPQDSKHHQHHRTTDAMNLRGPVAGCGPARFLDSAGSIRRT